MLSKILLAGALLLSPLARANDAIVLNSDNTVVLRGVIDGGSVTAVQMDLVKQVLKRGFRKYPIYLVLDSPGGSIEAGFMFIQFAKHISNLHTISIFSASMASAIVEELPGQRLVTENGTLMFHKAYAGVEGTVETGTLEAQLYYIKKQVLRLENGNATRMRTRLTDYKTLVANELWLDSDDSMRYRAADRIVDIVCTAELIKQTYSTHMMSMFGDISLEFSACPLFRVPFTTSNNKAQYKFGANAVNSTK